MTKIPDFDHSFDRITPPLSPRDRVFLLVRISWMVIRARVEEDCGLTLRLRIDHPQHVGEGEWLPVGTEFEIERTQVAGFVQMPQSQPDA